MQESNGLDNSNGSTNDEVTSYPKISNRWWRRKESSNTPLGARDDLNSEKSSSLDEE